MIWPLPICFKRAFCLLWPCAFVAASATVTGQVMVVAKQEGRGLSDSQKTVVWLSPRDQSASVAPSSMHARMLQKNKHFEPHILPVEVGTQVDFPNLDPIFHNAFSSFDGQVFDIGLYPPGSSRSIHFRREGLVRVFCNIHPAMSAVIVVLATPYFAVTERNGRYTLQNVPDGEYKLHFFYERATPETLDAITRTVTVASSVTDLGEVKISEAGYIPTPHKNKYGHDYPPDNTTGYH